ncbi:unnamed protein product [Closterium sp. NIES-53]
MSRFPLLSLTRSPLLVFFPSLGSLLPFFLLCCVVSSCPDSAVPSFLIYILTDINNCGVCSNFCDLTQTCCNGTCINPNTNNAHCGACGARCPGTCAAGVCNYGGVTSSPGNGNGGAGNGLAGNGNNGAGPVVPPTGGSGPVVPGTGGPAAGGPGKSGMP